MQIFGFNRYRTITLSLKLHVPVGEYRVHV